MSDCIFCQIRQNQPDLFVYEDEQIFVLNDINPKADTHLLVITKEHIPSLNEVGADKAGLVADILQLIPKLAKENGLDAGYRTVVNTGRGGGQIIDHLHFHLLGGGRLPGF